MGSAVCFVRHGSKEDDGFRDRVGFDEAGREAMKRWIGRGLLVLLVLGALLAWRAQRESDRVSRLPSTEAYADTTGWSVASLRPLEIQLPDSVQELGRVAWEGRGAPIAFDAKDSADAKFDVYFVSPGGGPAECLTCEIPWLAGRNVGNPAWSADGRFLLLQIENEEPLAAAPELSPLIADASYPGFGLSSSLWVYDRTARTFHLLDEIDGSDGWGVLHPHFSHDGRRVTWARVLSDDGCMGEMQVMVGDFEPAPEPHLENVRRVGPQLPRGQRFFETQDFRADEILVACTPEEGQQHHFMDLCVLDVVDGSLRRLSAGSGRGGEPGSWEEHAKYLDDDHVLFVSSRGYPSPVEECDMSSASFMKWLKTDLYVQSLREPPGGGPAVPERLTFWNEPDHEGSCDCGNALASDFSWNAAESAAVLFVQFLDWPRWLPLPIGFDARYFIVDLEPERTPIEEEK